MGEEKLPVEETTEETPTSPGVTPFDLWKVTNAQSEDAYYDALFAQMEKEKEFIMEETPIKSMFANAPIKLDRDSVKEHLKIWVSLYLQKLELVYIQNPILIKVNQETALEIEAAIKNATTEDEAKKLQRSRAAAMQQIKKLKDEIDMENIGKLLLQMSEIIGQLQDQIAE